MLNVRDLPGPSSGIFLTIRLGTGASYLQEARHSLQSIILRFAERARQKYARVGEREPSGVVLSADDEIVDVAVCVHGRRRDKRGSKGSKGEG